MKAITLHQPWATLVAIGAKRIETRSWSTNYRGPLAIHAGKKLPNINPYFLREPFHSCLLGHKIPLGFIVATCELLECYQIDASDLRKENMRGWEVKGKFFERTSEELAFGLYEVGRWMWFLDDVKILDTPILAKGAQRLWEWKEPEPKLTIYHKDGSKTEVTPLKMWDPREE